MEYKYKAVSILFSMDTNNDPFRMIADVEDYYKRDGCVVALKSYCGNLFVCTLCDEDIVDRVKKENCIFLGRKRYEYKQVDSYITCLKIDLPYWNVSKEDINRMLRVYTNVLMSDIIQPDKNNRTYYAIVEMRRDLPTRLKSKSGFVDVVEIV